MISYISSYLVMASIYGIMALGLNFQWGFSGLMNFGIGASYMLGAYTAALLSAAPTPEHLGGFGVPFPVDLIGAALIPAFIAFLIGFPALRLKGGPFAIATLAIHETIYLIVHNEMWLTNGVWGIRDITRPLYANIPQRYDTFFLVIAGGFLIFFYFFFKKLVRTPWGRVVRGVKGDEDMALMSGKHAWSYKMQSFVLGSAVAGVAGGLYVHYTGFVSPTVYPADGNLHRLVNGHGRRFREQQRCARWGLSRLGRLDGKRVLDGLLSPLYGDPGRLYADVLDGYNSADCNPDQAAGNIWQGEDPSPVPEVDQGKLYS